MFVHNCIVDRSETLVFRKKERKQKRAKGKQSRGAANPDEEYFPVVCGECNAVVAVYDHDEVYHVSHAQQSAVSHATSVHASCCLLGLEVRVHALYRVHTRSHPFRVPFITVIRHSRLLIPPLLSLARTQ